LPAENIDTTNAKTSRACTLARAGTDARTRQNKLSKKIVGKTDQFMKKTSFGIFRKIKVPLKQGKRARKLLDRYNQQSILA